MNQINRPPRQMRIEAKKNQLKSPIMVANTVVYSNTFSTRGGSETNHSVLYLITYDVACALFFFPTAFLNILTFAKWEYI